MVAGALAPTPVLGSLTTGGLVVGVLVWLGVEVGVGPQSPLGQSQTPSKQVSPPEEEEDSETLEGRAASG